MTEIWQVTLDGTQSGVSINNVFGCEAGDEADGNDIAEAFWAAFANTFIDVVADDYHLTGAHAINLTNPTEEGQFTDEEQGAIDGPTLPTFACANVGWTTGLRGRAYRGRTGLAGMLESYTANDSPNRLQSDPLSAIGVAAGEFIEEVNSRLTTSAGRFVVVSKVLAGAPRVAPLATEVTGYSVKALLGTRRSRLT